MGLISGCYLASSKSYQGMGGGVLGAVNKDERPDDVTPLIPNEAVNSEGFESDDKILMEYQRLVLERVVSSKNVLLTFQTPKSSFSKLSQRTNCIFSCFMLLIIICIFKWDHLVNES